MKKYKKGSIFNEVLLILFYQFQIGIDALILYNSNPHPDRPIAQPRRRLNRTTSTNSVGSVGSATGSTSPLANFSFGSPSSVTAAKPPVQPALGSFGASNPPGFNTQPNNNIGFQSGFGSPMANPPVTSTNTPTIGFGAFGSPSVPSTATNQPFGGLGSQNNTSTSSSSSSIGAFGSIPTSNAGGFQSGFGNTSGSLFSGFGKYICRSTWNYILLTF